MPNDEEGREAVVRKSYSGCSCLGRGRGHGLFFALFIITLGVILFLDQMGVARASYLFQYFWPVIFCFFGLEGLLFGWGPGRFWGGVLTLLGALLVLDNLGYLHFRWGMLWPLLLVTWGVWMLVRALGANARFPGVYWGLPGMYSRKGNTGAGPASQGDYSSEEFCYIDAVFSTVRRRLTTKKFLGGRLSAIFGESETDLTGAEIEGQEAVIHADAVFGAHKIRVPDTWHVVMRGTAVFGEFSDKTMQRPLIETQAKRLVVRGAAVFGSVIVRN